MRPEPLQALLLARGETVCCAESLTGGALAVLLSQTPGASRVFRGGVVSYATDVKQSLLGVAVDHVVSAECASQMAAGVRDLIGADWALSTTGVAGPDPQDDEPVGTVFIGVSGPNGTRVVRLSLAGSRDRIRTATCEAALAELASELR